MTGFLLILFGASVFSIGGVGEDRSVFRDDFLGQIEKAQIEFSLRPEFNVLNESSEFRGLFWTNPFHFGLKIPVTSAIVLSAGNQERYNQTFDLYLENNQLNVHLTSDGGVGELYGQVNSRVGGGEASFPAAELYFRGAYLFGNTNELWTYVIGDYSIIDTFQYQYQGYTMACGFSLSIFSCAFEGLGSLNMKNADADSSLRKDMPERLSVGVHPAVGKYAVDLAYERSFWSGAGYVSPDRFKIGMHRGSAGLAYAFNPWYMKNVTEHGLVLENRLGFGNLGFSEIGIALAFRERNSIREIMIVPEIKLTLEEVFARRKK